MPEKTYGRCGHGTKRCLRCWQNKMTHGNPTATKYVIKNDSDFEINGKEPEPVDTYCYTVQCKSRGDLRHVILQIKKMSPYSPPINTAYLKHNDTRLDNLGRTLKYYGINDGDELIYQVPNQSIYKYTISFMDK